jgi:hypothetical protein
MGFISGEFIEKFGVSTTAQIRLDLKKYIPKNNMLFLGIICAQDGINALGLFLLKASL